MPGGLESCNSPAKVSRFFLEEQFYKNNEAQNGQKLRTEQETQSVSFFILTLTKDVY